MTCNKCGNKTLVLETRGGPNQTVRRHVCTKCNTQFFTVEEKVEYLEGLNILGFYRQILNRKKKERKLELSKKQ